MAQTLKPIPAFSILWLDLEMTGLNAQHNTILEIACVITDVNLNVLGIGPDLVIHQPNAALESMDDWCKKQHAKSGLTKAVQESTIDIATAEQETLQFAKRFAQPDTIRLAGNSVWQDRIFLQKYMPALVKYINYRLIDVSSIKEVVRAWYPHNPNTEFKKKDLHRAMPDVLESIEELQHYRKHFFVPAS